MHQHITINGKTYTAEEAPLLKDRFASEYGEDSNDEQRTPYCIIPRTKGW